MGKLYFKPLISPGKACARRSRAMFTTSDIAFTGWIDCPHSPAVIMDGSSIDWRPCPSKLAANSKSLEFPRRFPPCAFAPPSLSRRGLCRRTASRSPRPLRSPRMRTLLPPTLQAPPVVEEVTPPATPADASQQPAKETNICFTGEGSIKEVLDACAAYIASGPTTRSTGHRAQRPRHGLVRHRRFDGALPR